MHVRAPHAWRAGRPAAALLPLLVATACATTGATFRSGVGDRFLERPPFYAGADLSPGGGLPAAHFPIAWQRGSTQPAMFEPKAEGDTPVAALLAEMNAYLDSLGVTTRIAVSGNTSGTPPDVMFGCQRDTSDECVKNGDATAGHDEAHLRLAVGLPSNDWTGWAAARMDSAGAPRALVLTLEIGEYFTRQKNLRGQKEVLLGTGHSVSVPWLTSLDTPVSVLQLTGALVGRDGLAIRIGAEGLLAQRTNLLESGFGLQRLISDEDIAALRNARRSDLAGQPLVWQAALRTLVGELTGRRDLIPR